MLAKIPPLEQNKLKKKTLIEPPEDPRNAQITEFMIWLETIIHDSELKLSEALQNSNKRPCSPKNIHLPHLKAEKSGLIKVITPNHFVMVLLSRHLGILKNLRILACSDCFVKRYTKNILHCQNRQLIQKLCLLVFSNVDFVFKFDEIWSEATKPILIDNCEFRAQLLRHLQLVLSVACWDPVSKQKLQNSFNQIKFPRSSDSHAQVSSNEEMLQPQQILKRRILRILQSMDPNHLDQSTIEKLRKSLFLISLNTIYWGLARMTAASAHKVDFTNEQNAHFLRKIFSDGFKETHVFVIDCRFEYEFHGGHIKGAFNINDPRVLVRLFFEHKWTQSSEFFSYLAEFRDSRVDFQLANSILDRFREIKSQTNESHSQVSQDFPESGRGFSQNLTNDTCTNRTEQSNLQNSGTDLESVDDAQMEENPQFLQNQSINGFLNNFQIIDNLEKIQQLIKEKQKIGNTIFRFVQTQSNLIILRQQAQVECLQIQHKPFSTRSAPNFLLRIFQ